MKNIEKFEVKNYDKEAKIKVTKSLIVEYEKNEEMKKLLENFRDMVNFCIEKGLKYGYSLNKLHENCYKELKKKYNYNCIFFVKLIKLLNLL
jgi:phosphopantetheine adenylyltransferase